jgi:hypothetical protein
MREAIHSLNSAQTVQIFIHTVCGVENEARGALEMTRKRVDFGRPKSANEAEIAEAGKIGGARQASFRSPSINSQSSTGRRATAAGSVKRAATRKALGTTKHTDDTETKTGPALVRCFVRFVDVSGT